jgi:hypothetical protein
MVTWFGGVNVRVPVAVGAFSGDIARVPVAVGVFSGDIARVLVAVAVFGSVALGNTVRVIG